MRARYLLTAVALWATTVFAVEIFCTFILIIFILDGDLIFLSAPASEHEESLDVHSEDPVLAVTASFPESNPFGRKSLMYVTSLRYVTQNTV